MTYTRFSPRRPIKSFQDLEVYQKLLAVSVAVAKRIGGQGVGSGLVSLALDLPVKIATAHSWRFSDKTKAIAILEEVMLGINILIVYLEQYRDIDNVPVPRLKTAVDGPEAAEAEKSAMGRAAATADATPAAIEHEFFEEQINSLSVCRWKVMHLARSWEKFQNHQLQNEGGL